MNTTYEWKMYNISDNQNQQMLNDLNNLVSDLDMEDAARRLMKGLMDRFKSARAKEEFDIATFISEAISENFSSVLTQSMDEFFQTRYPSAASRDDAARKIIDDLKQRAVIMFPCSNDIPSVDTFYASIPKDAGCISEIAGSDAQLASNQITSPYTNRISIFTFASGISAAHHNTMHLYEEGYYEFAFNSSQSENAYA